MLLWDGSGDLLRGASPFVHVHLDVCARTWVCAAPNRCEPGVQPSIATVHDNSYPISRPLFMYTPGDPPQHVKAYIDWVISDAGQKIVEETGYVPLPKK